MRHVPSGADTHGLTHIGRARSKNEDQFLIASLSKTVLIDQTSLPPADHTRLIGPEQGLLLVVADGMGGHEGGGIASAVAVDALMTYVLGMMPWFFHLDVDREDDLKDQLASAIDRAQTVVQQAGSATDKPDMGAAVTMAYVLWPRAYVVHVGDTRAYLARGDKLHRITKDHTFGQQLTDRGVPQAQGSPWEHVLWNAVGGPTGDLAPQVTKAYLEPGDVLLLSTDGVTKHVDDGQIAETLRLESARMICESLVQAANEAGGSDNITAVCARCH